MEVIADASGLSATVAPSEKDGVEDRRLTGRAAVVGYNDDGNPVIALGGGDNIDYTSQVRRLHEVGKTGVTYSGFKNGKPVTDQKTLENFFATRFTPTVTLNGVQRKSSIPRPTAKSTG